MKLNSSSSLSSMSSSSFDFSSSLCSYCSCAGVINGKCDFSNSICDVAVWLELSTLISLLGLHVLILINADRIIADCQFLNIYYLHHLNSLITIEYMNVFQNIVLHYVIFSM